MRNRQKAEIQLRSLLNESEKSLPAFVHRAGDNLGSEQLSVEQISKLLKTQEFLIRRLVRIFYPSTENVQDVKTLTILQAQKLTCILNSTMEVRALVFFMIFDEAGDEYVTRAGMTEFYEKYFRGLKTLDGDRIQEVVQGLLQKFHLDRFTTEPNIGWVGGFASLSGLLLCIILSVIVVCSMRWIRRGFILGILLVAFIVFAFLYIAYYSCYELLGKPLLVADDYTFKLNKAATTTKYWICTINGCAAKLHTDSNNGLMKTVGSRSHLPGKEKLEVREAREKMTYLKKNLLTVKTST
ncbi:unnamed protein product [Rotaria magnacalcarata]|uniref:FLYWCH-type domain-containing protein n=1 Tax=Rotaria magnacalcarata TaxID=392030 RepID=A0A815IIZ6_9BILA|nr:unnamed protein product [Rotaria magnacalcarata]